ENTLVSRLLTKTNSSSFDKLSHSNNITAMTEMKDRSVNGRPMYYFPQKNTFLNKLLLNNSNNFLDNLMPIFKQQNDTLFLLSLSGFVLLPITQDSYEGQLLSIVLPSHIVEEERSEHKFLSWMKFD
ncbi:hypothetical protein, partial [Salmonella sp. s51228]|uniref:hypothetical protein n=1 Tax=Salmonella sp. s51228 TaxID=3159652 RepID=UPI0039811B13